MMAAEVMVVVMAGEVRLSVVTEAAAARRWRWRRWRGRR